MESVKQIASSLGPECAQQIGDIAQANSELVSKCQQQRQQLASLIRDMTRRVEAVREDAARVEPVSVHSTRMAQLHSEKEAVRRNIRSTGLGREEMAKKMEDAKQEEMRIREEIAQLHQKRSHASKQLESTLQLYTSVFPVRWNHANSSTSSVVGFVSLPDKQEVVPFNFSTEKMSAFEITNSIWKLQD
eukprot:c7075_g1_i1.p1 GENE.c7075_g1_i1~~c7075_g1_i1.p1  ORF type:complete len:189 (+),score=51.12 c7075_g1_i1:64-630(+)